MKASGSRIIKDIYEKELGLVYENAGRIYSGDPGSKILLKLEFKVRSCVEDLYG